MIELQELLETTQADLIYKGQSTHFENICIDSRLAQPGFIFFCLKGSHFNGHDFIPEAVKNGAVAIVCSEAINQIDGISILKVNDTIKALGKLARFNRLKYQIPVIAVTGSVGKTTTKELISKQLEKYGNTVATFSNQNNQIGVPLTLLKINSSTKFAVVELGSNHPGEIAVLAALIRPTHSVITPVGASHLESFGSIDAVIQEKLSVLEYTDQSGYLAVDGTNKKLLEKSYKKADSIGFDRSHIIIYDEHNTILVEKDIANANLSAAMSILKLILPKQNITLCPAKTPLRMERHTINGASVILDCYNANPISFKYAIDKMTEIEAERRFIVIGDMAELGKNSMKYHIDIINMIKAIGKTELIVCGTLSRNAADLCEVSAHYFDNNKQIAEYLIDNLRAGDQLLIKGSREFKMERIWQEMLKIVSGKQLSLRL